ncbi:bifunctional adenosylcobinamide kinase/adenosylcobinamide-phosphate guanylyltransferase [Aidingimonas lacisalsi]|uniref:bifunctional adenosylcobinamide kinase/adenosylcobinamide-phosphate guanylyltransferase n=1 Tax=Aidingimonas lacisalsi TaxID=2604086 RepID=UPI0011D269C0|nr:bifunctional adenosylcobinamide kinase/adenosylcobinamide-phosphate guanylyltransferase [Aidingimonas lacisalsi]
MQLFIGGACSGRRALVAGRFPTANWHRLTAGEEVDGWLRSHRPGLPLVVTGWLDWLQAVLVEQSDDKALRGMWRSILDALTDAERMADTPVVLILDEMGRGVVPMTSELRRLRDLNGWLVQDAAAACEAIWYVRHGLVQRLEARESRG